MTAKHSVLRDAVSHVIYFRIWWPLGPSRSSTARVTVVVTNILDEPPAFKHTSYSMPLHAARLALVSIHTSVFWLGTCKHPLNLYSEVIYWCSSVLGAWHHSICCLIGAVVTLLRVSPAAHVHALARTQRTQTRTRCHIMRQAYVHVHNTSITCLLFDNYLFPKLKRPTEDTVHVCQGGVVATSGRTAVVHQDAAGADGFRTVFDKVDGQWRWILSS